MYISGDATELTLFALAVMRFHYHQVCMGSLRNDHDRTPSVITIFCCCIQTQALASTE